MLPQVLPLLNVRGFKLATDHENTALPGGVVAFNELRKLHLRGPFSLALSLSQLRRLEGHEVDASAGVAALLRSVGSSSEALGYPAAPLPSPFLAHKAWNRPYVLGVFDKRCDKRPAM